MEHATSIICIHFLSFIDVYILNYLEFHTYTCITKKNLNSKNGGNKLSQKSAVKSVRDIEHVEKEFQR